jgi:SAM-dependent methyltransferase
VLDVGCGCGRVALPLTEYLSPQGGFDGFDIMPSVIGWCQRAITPRFPNFRFVLADLHSDRYHPDGTSSSSRYVFPYPDGVFDYVFLGSVFTHMLPADVDNYLGEIARVMKPGGQCVISYYLLNSEREEAIAAGGSMWRFTHHGPGYRAEYAHLPEAVTGYDEASILGLYQAKQLEITEIRRGLWPTRPIQDQDIIVARKPT